MPMHNPGPWELDMWGNVIAADGTSVARIYECSESMATARLIAAAPQLLEALEEVVVPASTCDCERCVRVRVLIRRIREGT